MTEREKLLSNIETLIEGLRDSHTRERESAVKLETARDHALSLEKLIEKVRIDRNAATERVVELEIDQPCHELREAHLKLRVAKARIVNWESENKSLEEIMGQLEARIAELEAHNAVLKSWLHELMSPWHYAHGDPETNWPNPECVCRGCMASRGIVRVALADDPSPMVKDLLCICHHPESEHDNGHYYNAGCLHQETNGPCCDCDKFKPRKVSQ